MSWSRKAWVVATSVGAVEALKDQMGICRWNYVIRSAHQHAKSKLRVVSQAAKEDLSPSSAAVMVSKMQKMNGDEKLKKTEESIRKVMELDCWGLNRF